MLILICFIVLAQAYLFEWMIPKYQLLDSKAIAAVSNPATGYMYFFILLAILATLCLIVFILNKKNSNKAKVENLITTK